MYKRNLLMAMFLRDCDCYHHSWFLWAWIMIGLWAWISLIQYGIRKRALFSHSLSLEAFFCAFRKLSWAWMNVISLIDPLIPRVPHCCRIFCAILQGTCARVNFSNANFFLENPRFALHKTFKNHTVFQWMCAMRYMTDWHTVFPFEAVYLYAILLIR